MPVAEMPTSVARVYSALFVELRRRVDDIDDDKSEVFGIARRELSPRCSGAVRFDLDVAVLCPVVIVLGVMLAEVDGVANPLVINDDLKDPRAAIEQRVMDLLLRLYLGGAL